MNQEKKEKSSMSKISYDLSICPTCKGLGQRIYNYSPEGYEGILAYYSEPCPTCNGGLAERTLIVKKHSNIPKVFYDKNYECFNWNIYKDNNGNIVDLSKKRKLIEDFLKNYKSSWRPEGFGLYIHSVTKGSGKTFLSSCICNELMELYGITTRFVNATELLDISQSGDKNSNIEYERDPIKLLCNCELLVIDDIGQKKTGYDWLNEILFRIVDNRMTKGLVTIFTSNISLEGLNLDERVVERISRVSVSIGLPEFNVRTREAYDKKISFLKKIYDDDKGDK